MIFLVTKSRGKNVNFSGQYVHLENYTFIKTKIVRLIMRIELLYLFKLTCSSCSK